MSANVTSYLLLDFTPTDSEQISPSIRIPQGRGYTITAVCSADGTLVVERERVFDPGNWDTIETQALTADTPVHLVGYGFHMSIRVRMTPSVSGSGHAELDRIL